MAMLTSTTAYINRRPCRAKRCKLDLLTFDDDSSKDETADDHAQDAFVCLCHKKPVSHSDKTEKSLLEYDLYDPAFKGETTWHGSFLTTPGWHIATRPGEPVGRQWYHEIKGIDLVNWFTDNYLQEQEKARLAKEQRISKLEALHEDRTCHSGFLALPGEIRQMIYKFAIPSARILIRQIQAKPTSTEPDQQREHQSTHTNHAKSRLCHYMSQSDVQKGHKLSPAILLVCHQMRQEAEPVYYEQLLFTFNSKMVVHRFLDQASIFGVELIRKIQLMNLGSEDYHRRGLIEDDTHQWRQTCQRIAKRLPQLKSLTIGETICDWPVTLTSHDAWWDTLMLLVPDKPLDHVKVMLSFKDDTISKEKLRYASQRLEDAMMSREGQRRRDEREANRLIRIHEELEAAAEKARIERLRSLPPVQARKVLRIVVDNKADKKEDDGKKVVKKYYSSKTQNYAIAQENDSYAF